MADLFINYRRSDTGDYAERLAELLDDFELDVWYDRGDIDYGDSWEREIRSALSKCSIVLVLIGPNWITPRLDLPDDWVRREIELAKTMGKKVIPVLFDFTIQELASAKNLPRSLHYLFDLQARSIDVDSLKRQLTDFCAELTARRKAESDSDGVSKQSPNAALDHGPSNGSAAATGRSRAPRTGSFRFQLAMMMIVLVAATIGALAAQIKFPELPKTLWLLPAGMLMSTCLFYLYTGSRAELRTQANA